MWRYVNNRFSLSLIHPLATFLTRMLMLPIQLTNQSLSPVFFSSFFSSSSSSGWISPWPPTWCRVLPYYTEYYWQLDPFLFLCAFIPSKFVFIILYLLERFFFDGIPSIYKDEDNKNGDLWSQARMRIEMRLRCYLVIWSLVICN